MELEFEKATSILDDAINQHIGQAQKHLFKRDFPNAIYQITKADKMRLVKEFVEEQQCRIGELCEELED